MRTLTCNKQNHIRSKSVIHGNSSIKIIPWYHSLESHYKQYTLLVAQMNISITVSLRENTKTHTKTKQIETPTCLCPPHFPRIKRESWCSMTNPIQLLAAAAAAAAAAVVTAVFPGSNGKVGAPSQMPSDRFLLLRCCCCCCCCCCRAGSPRSPPSPPPPCQAHRPSESVPSYPLSLGRKGTSVPHTGRSSPSPATPTSSPPAPPPCSRCCCCSA